MVATIKMIFVTGCEPMLLEDIGAGRVMATSGCVSNVTHVSFKWIKISTINGIEEEFIPTIKSNYSSKCSNESDCWIDEHMQYNVIIQASQSDNGQYYLKMIAIYGNELKESSNTYYKYIIDGQDFEVEDHDISTQHLATIIMVAVSICLLYFASMWYCLRKINCKRTSKGDGKLDNPHERKELVKKTLQPANTYQIERSFHNKRSLHNCRSDQASPEGNTDLDENKSDL
ncbi:uncharacterized protein LOC132741466 [Ruditapes philippinarum]|uniref:uncharacterized protein LOC132741466 n=1 Tax=Ruditapes philippinarum TaxID=129788 RepID=UPI00295AE6A9|nr:uncharacterized protein LOC132741466 [Ruditapes philippinarum]